MEASRDGLTKSMLGKSDKDTIIAELRSEIFNMRHVAKQFGELNTQLESLQGKYDLLLEERDRNQRDHKMKAEMDSAALEELQNELQKLNEQLDRASTEQQQHESNNAALERLLEAKHRQTDQTKRENLSIKARLEKKRGEVAGKFAQLRSLKQEKNRAEQELGSERQSIDKGILQCKKLEREVKAKQTEAAKLQKKLLSMKSEKDRIKQQLQQNSEQIRRSASKLSSMELTFDEMMQQLKEMEKLKQQREVQLADSRETYQQEAKANRQLQARLIKLQGEIRCKQREVDDMLTRRSQQMQLQQKQSETNQSLNARLDRSIESILQYQSINQQLIAEIRQYCRTDQKARQLLNRSGRVEQLVGRVQKRIKTSCGAISHILKR